MKTVLKVESLRHLAQSLRELLVRPFRLLDLPLVRGRLRLDHRGLLRLGAQRVLRRLQRFVAARHAHERGFPLRRELLLLVVDRLHLPRSLFQGGARGARLFALRDELRFRERVRLVQSLEVL